MELEDDLIFFTIPEEVDMIVDAQKCPLTTQYTNDFSLKFMVDIYQRAKSSQGEFSPEKKKKRDK